MSGVKRLHFKCGFENLLGLGSKASQRNMLLLSILFLCIIISKSSSYLEILEEILDLFLLNPHLEEIRSKRKEISLSQKFLCCSLWFLTFLNLMELKTV